MKNLLKRIAALALAGCLMIPAVAAANSNVTFKDVPNSNGIYAFVLRAAQENLVSGMGDGKFGVGKNVSNAEFAAMIGNLFYKSEVDAYAASYQLSYWWQSYMAVAYQKGLLDNTAVGENRRLSNGWSKTVVEASISRYDMAQVIANVSKWQGWPEPTAQEKQTKQKQIGDWSTIQSQYSRYQDAVSFCYAQGFLSGQEDGTFGGTSPMLREHSAVVLCRLLDAKNNNVNNVYTNTTNLVNGKAATESNVEAAVAALKASYPANAAWDTASTNSYTSNVLGRITGRGAYAYILSDKVFGTFKAEYLNGKEAASAGLKAGDLIFLNSSNVYVLVEKVSGNNFYYTCATTSGKISWNNVGYISDLTASDSVITRYEDSTTGDRLTNGKPVTEANVSALLNGLAKDKTYGDGEYWNTRTSHTTDLFGRCQGSEAFAGALSDAVFGKLKSVEHYNIKNLKVGDVVYLEYYNQYMVVTAISGSGNNARFTYVTVDEYGDIKWGSTYYLSDFDGGYDSIYTRYPNSTSSGSSSGSNSSKTGTLSNGKTVNAANVSALLNELANDDLYADGEYWNMKTYHTTQLFGRSMGSKAFAGALSDAVFGKLDSVEHSDVGDLAVGDVVYLDYYDQYVVVTAISGTGSKAQFTYASVDDDGDIRWGDRYYVDDFDTEYDAIYTRYPGFTSTNTHQASNRLTNNKTVTEVNVTALLNDLADSSTYRSGKTWNMNTSRTTNLFGRSTGSQGFAGTLSDEIFGKLSYKRHTQINNLKVGDVVYIDMGKEYVVVTGISGSGTAKRFTYVTVESDGEIVWYQASKAMYFEDFDSEYDYIYTRYPSAQDKDKLANGKAATAENVSALLSDLELKSGYRDGSSWGSGYYTTELFGRCSGAKAFAAVISDEIFGSLSSTEHWQFSNLKVGDVVYLVDDDLYTVVTRVRSGNRFDYAAVEGGKITWSGTATFDANEDFIYTRYPTK